MLLYRCTPLSPTASVWAEFIMMISCTGILETMKVCVIPWSFAC